MSSSLSAAPPIPFTCPHCGVFTQVAARYAGESGPCGQCGKTITVPMPHQAAVRGAPPREAASAAFGQVILIGLTILGGAMAAGLMSLVFFYGVVPSLNAARTSARRSACAANLVRLAEAMQQYHDDYGAFPPAYLADERGKPMHSWRVLLLPYLDHQWLYDKYDFSEPWDGPNNLSLVSRMPEVFVCPDDPVAQGMGETNYVVIVGPRTMFPGAQSRTRQEVEGADGLANTLLIVEAPSQGRAWLSPVDLDASRMSYEMGVDVGGSHTTVSANAVMADGNTKVLPDTTTREGLRAMVTIDDGR